MSILVFLLVLSVIVGIHELGHFLAAKACGIYVDRFSIGMPPRIAGFKWGETDYCIGALPIGGYVKMAGQEDSPLSEEERQRDYGGVPPERWFNNKPVWQRSFVLIAGPAMNVVLAVVLYATLAALGSQVPESELTARIGKIESGSPAQTAPLFLYEPGKEPLGEPVATGWQTGDLILSINGNAVENIPDLAIAAILGGADQPHDIVIDRPNPDGTATRYVSRVTPKLLPDEEYPRFGVAPFDTPEVQEVLPGMPAATAGLQKGDLIRRADGKMVDSVTFVETVEKTPQGASLDLEVERDGQPMRLTLTPETNGRLKGVMLPLEAKEGEEQPEPIVLAVTKEYKETAKLQRKDKIVEVNGQPATVALINQLAKESPDGKLEVQVERPAVLFGLIQKAETLSLSLPVESVRAIGTAHRARTIFHRVPPGQILPTAFRQSYKAIEQTVQTIGALIRRDVSPKDLGGPVMIFELTARAAEAGWAWLLKISAFISINLAVFNLLPLPVLDGGQLVINGIEAIRRKPMNPVFLERFQQVGLVFIICLMLFVTWNDVGRWITDRTP